MLKELIEAQNRARVAAGGTAATIIRYYATLGKIMHLWRDNARDMFTNWVKHFGAVNGMTHAQQVPPKPLVGRWGNTTLCEKHLDRCPGRQLKPLLLSMLADRKEDSEKLVASMSRKMEASGGELDEMGHEDMQVYAMRQSKYAKDASAG
eukprot:9489067-Pyramimonas_sp.AAC.1